MRTGNKKRGKKTFQNMITQKRAPILSHHKRGPSSSLLAHHHCRHHHHPTPQTCEHSIVGTRRKGIFRGKVSTRDDRRCCFVGIVALSFSTEKCQQSQHKSLIFKLVRREKFLRFLRVTSVVHGMACAGTA